MYFSAPPRPPWITPPHLSFLLPPLSLYLLLLFFLLYKIVKWHLVCIGDASMNSNNVRVHPCYGVLNLLIAHPSLCIHGFISTNCITVSLTVHTHFLHFRSFVLFYCRTSLCHIFFIFKLFWNQAICLHFMLLIFNAYC